jgi:hypothetical protein
MVNLTSEFYKKMPSLTNLKCPHTKREIYCRRNKDLVSHQTRLKLKDSTFLKTINDASYRQLNYVRHMSNFIVGMTCSIKEAQEIKAKINDFMQEELLLTTIPNNTKVKRASNPGVKFLGLLVNISMCKKAKNAKYIKSNNKSKIFIQTGLSQASVKLKVDIKSIIKRLYLAGFCDKRGKPIPQFQIYEISHRDIISSYNKALREILNLYKFTDNYKSLEHCVQYILINSCAKLLAAKLKLKTTSAVFKKFGKGLNNQHPKFTPPKTLRSSHKTRKYS